VPWRASGNLAGRTLPRASRAHGAALAAPLLGLLDEQRAHEADDRGSIREDAHHIGAPADLLVQALLKGLVLQSWRQSSSAEVRQGQQVTTGLLEVSSSLEAASQPARQPLVGTEPPPRWRPAGRRWCAPGLPRKGCLRPRHLGEQIPQVVGATPLLGGPCHRPPSLTSLASSRSSIVTASST
jgi:hypothetical protein